MSYLSAPLKLCLLLLPLLGLFAGLEPASAEEKLAVSFELPPVESTVPLPVLDEAGRDEAIRYEDSLPPIAPIDLQPGDIEEVDVASERSPHEIALQFARNDIEMPVVSHQLQNDKVGTVASAFEVNATSADLLATASEQELAWSSSSSRVKAMQQRLARSTSTEPVINAAELLEADILEDWIYEGGSDSLVARTVGSAEGTRRSNGERTTAYYGHTDPGNGVWNLGTFSYQHEARSPEEADEKQLKRLQRQEKQLKEKAAKWNVPLSMEVRLNGLDLANQAPLAALDKGGYIERLAEAYANGKSGEAAIAWARTHAYFDPDKQAWDAPGLGNNQYSIQRDQERRMAAIDSALRRYEYEHAGQISGLSELRIASNPGTANDHLLLAQAESTAIDSAAILDFSLEPVSFSTPETVEPQPVELSTLEEPADVEDQAAIDSDDEADLSAAVETTSSAVDSLAFEDDRLALNEWDEHYESVADETATLVDTEAIAIDDDLVFEETAIADILAENEPQPKPEASVANTVQPVSRPVSQPVSQSVSQPEESKEERLSRLQAGAKKRDLSLPDSLSSQEASADSPNTATIRVLPTEEASSNASDAATEAATTISMNKEDTPTKTSKRAFIRTEDSIVRSK